MRAFADELMKIAATQARSSSSVWAPKTVGAPRSKMPGTEQAKAPTVPGKLSPKVIKPASQFGERQNYSQSNTATTPETNPVQQQGLRSIPPPNVVFGAR